jgi:hypothetical protein
VRAIERQALQSEGNRPETWTGLQTEFMERTPAIKAIEEPSTKHEVEAARLDAFTLPGSPLDDTLSYLSLRVSLIRASSWPYAISHKLYAIRHMPSRWNL